MELLRTIALLTPLNDSNLEETLFAVRRAKAINALTLIPQEPIKNEKDFFDKLTYREAPKKPLAGDDIILISAPVAETLGARTGDRIFLKD